MKKHFYSALVLSCLLSSAFAVETPKQVTTPPAPKTAVQQKKSVTINLYDAPSDKSKIIKQLPINENLVPVFAKGDWVKVGDRGDGTTGWINKKQYRDARNQYYQQYVEDHVQSFYMTTVKGKDGKTVVEAYRNGKKLTEAEANKLYVQMQAQQKQQWEAMQRFNFEAQQALDSAFYPGIVIVEPAATPADTKKK